MRSPRNASPNAGRLIEVYVEARELREGRGLDAAGNAIPTFCGAVRASRMAVIAIAVRGSGPVRRRTVSGRGGAAIGQAIHTATLPIERFDGRNQSQRRQSEIPLNVFRRFQTVVEMFLQERSAHAQAQTEHQRQREIER